MKIIKIIQTHKKASEKEIRDFIYRNMSQEMINGLEYDEPKTMKRALKMFGIEYDPKAKQPSRDDKNQEKEEQRS